MRLSRDRDRRRRIGAGLVALLATVTSLVAFASPAAADFDVIPDNTWSTNGRVNAILHVGNRIYIGGSFTAVKNRKGQTMPRKNLAALDANTGTPLDWAPQTNGMVEDLEASSDGGTIFVAGRFTAVNGTSRQHLAAVTAASGAVLGTWFADTDKFVFEVHRIGTRLYIAGDFTTVRGEARQRYAQVNTVNGALDPNWKPKANARGRAIKSMPDGRLVLGGNFTFLNGRRHHRIAIVDALSGNDDRNFLPPVDYPVLDVVAANGVVYAAIGGAGGGRVGAYNASNGNQVWFITADGDAQAIDFMNGKVYVGGHWLVIDGRQQKRFVRLNANNGSFDASFAPQVANQVWEIDVEPSRLYLGGQFGFVGGKKQGGYAQFTDAASGMVAPQATPDEPLTPADVAEMMAEAAVADVLPPEPPDEIPPDDPFPVEPVATDPPVTTEPPPTTAPPVATDPPTTPAPSRWEIPSAPRGLSGFVLPRGQVYLGWFPSAGGTPPFTYRIWRDGAEVGQSTNTRFVDTTTVPGATHRYTVDVVDATGRTSRQSAPIEVRIPRR